MGLEGDILFLEIVFFVWGSSEAAMGDGARSAPVGRGKEPKKTGARSARARTRGQNRLVNNSHINSRTTTPPPPPPQRYEVHFYRRIWKSTAICKVHVRDTPPVYKI